MGELEVGVAGLVGLLGRRLQWDVVYGDLAVPKFAVRVDPQDDVSVYGDRDDDDYFVAVSSKRANASDESVSVLSDDQPVRSVHNLARLFAVAMRDV